MIDFKALDKFGTTNKRIREFFTAKAPSVEQAARMTEEERAKLDLDIKQRQKFEEILAGWLSEAVVFSLRDSAKYQAVDMAWDSMPINKFIIPLMQYAQGRIDVAKAVKTLRELPDGATYVKKDDKGVETIDLPRFFEVNINLIRSVITRRTAAQVVKYNQLWPWFKYEARDQTQLGKLRADLVSQRMDIMADAYDYRRFQTQVTRDMFLYGRCVAFPRCSWESENTMEIGPDGNPKTKVYKEGICWVNPHPSRVFYDNSSALPSLNSDTGCEYVGFWDVARWKDVAGNAKYFNRDCVTYSSDTVGWFTQYSNYFSQYFMTIKAPVFSDAPALNTDTTIANDRKNNVGIYAATGMNDVSVFLSHFWVKVRPRDWGWGDYPYPIWVHLKVAGDCTVVYADIMPSSPAAVASYNEHDGRLVNISLAHELMPFQDQLTNLFSQLLETCKADLFSVGVLNRDAFPDTEEGKKAFHSFEAALKGKNYYSTMVLLEASFSKLKDLGINLTADNIFKVVRSSPSTAINTLLESITRVIGMADRLQVMSPHEQGQAASHEISATESNAISGSTDTMYNFISDSLDEFRGAQKRICFESAIACGEDEVRLPVSNRYPDSVVNQAGFKTVLSDNKELDGPIGFKVVFGPKTGLSHDYIFTSRDGGNRAANAQSATVLVQLFQAIGSLNPSAQNAIFSAMGKGKLFEAFNTIFRMADAGVDLKLDLKPGDSDELLLEDEQQVMQAIERLSQAVAKNTQDIQQITGQQQQLQPQPQ
jgi:hypothetical protein